MSDAATRPAEDDIDSERAFLSAARAALRRMHRSVVETETPQISSEDSDEIWQNTVYRLARERRAEALVDLPDVPLFFGRLDYRSGTVYERDAGVPPTDADRVYIGRRHVRDADSRPMVIDWRAAVSAPFYRATRDDPQGVRLRRRYGFSDTAELTAYEDEPLTGAATGADSASALLVAEIERPRVGPMRDIVATIQPEQDHLVRAPLHPTVCIQGAPGTGKTAVGLHRLAYLLYTSPDRLAGGVAVIGPNRSFLTYIRHVLPALGEVDVAQTTVEDLIGRADSGQAEAPEVQRVKGSARMAAVLHRALWAHVTTGDDNELVYAEGSYRYRVTTSRVSETIQTLRGATRYHVGRTALAQRLAHLVLVQMERRGATPDDRDQNAVARSKPVKQIVDRAWPRLTPERVLHRLLSDAAFLAQAADGLLTSDEQALVLWSKPYRSPKSAKWTTADAALLDELADLIERTPSINHIVVDEAQDISPMQCRALARRCTNGSFTVLGDLAQGTSPWAVDDWRTLLEHLDQPDAHIVVLDRGFRVPAQILDYAARLLPYIAPGLDNPTSIRSNPGALTIAEISHEHLPESLVLTVRKKLKGDGSLGLIAADSDIGGIYQRLLAEGLEAALLGTTADALETSRLVCVPASLAKGLEFDAIVVIEPARIVDAGPRGLQRLYVALTRAVTSLHIVHAEPLPAPLWGAPGWVAR
ncbi:HelD family protein [Actinoplanes derwentensis]|uniref:DNA helicase IV n=1 Tax=Actinoplanes derwentensis TaxID=113562 RepID=A0A1H2DCW3_9ACTN|nr:AAA family ATPase [Actinoplanes derwentensis]GID89964.1 DNA helicase [Actinoplanes derwentensis]SDT80570.1 DNA helicase IV [Actinoplanes derwentensis]